MLFIPVYGVVDVSSAHSSCFDRFLLQSSLSELLLFSCAEPLYAIALNGLNTLLVSVD